MGVGTLDPIYIYISYIYIIIDLFVYCNSNVVMVVIIRTVVGPLQLFASNYSVSEGIWNQRGQISRFRSQDTESRGSHVPDISRASFPCTSMGLQRNASRCRNQRHGAHQCPPCSSPFACHSTSRHHIEQLCNIAAHWPYGCVVSRNICRPDLLGWVNSRYSR